MRRILPALCLCLMVVWLRAAAQPHPHRDHGHRSLRDWPPQDSQDPKELLPYHQVATSNADFAFRLYKQLISERPDKNILLSPLSISTTLAMLSLGARSTTLTQILEGLRFNLTQISEREIHEGFRHILRKINLHDHNFKTHLGNSLFLDERLTPMEEFLEGIKELYAAEAFLTDFQDAAGAEKQINDHVRKETHGKIVDLVRGLERNSAMLLVNYIYFKAKWQKAFDVKQTTEQDFFVNEKTVVRIPMMKQKDVYHYYFYDKWLSCSVLRMDYKGNASAFFILPDVGKMREVEDSLQAEMLMRWDRSFKRSSWFSRKLELYFPKFSISGQYELEKILPHLGLQDLFTEEADFSGITEQSRLRVSKGVHKAVLDIGEEGTEASAATSTGTVFLSAPKITRTVLFNRPFLVAIVSTDTQSLLFLGKVVNPKDQ
ncbi:kallistatin-like [Tachyglossus aculeatus]|uniref:kallistatin-like n=1 Tax=Tachyglossus aculeatus TaxID=9261 RepID=UPI0018F3EC98|nr:kallistatin-like [Tachyglossus aculeatus]